MILFFERNIDVKITITAFLQQSASMGRLQATIDMTPKYGEFCASKKLYIYRQIMM